MELKLGADLNEIGVTTYIIHELYQWGTKSWHCQHELLLII